MTGLGEYKNFLEAAPAMLIVLKPDFTVVAVSDLYAQVSHVSRDDLVGRNFFSLFPDPSHAPVRASFEKVLRTKTPDVMPLRRYDMALTPTKGSATQVRYWAATNSPILGGDGEVLYIVRRTDDITSWQQLRQESDVFFENAHDLLAVVSPDGYFKRLSPSFERVLGYSLKELMSRPLTDFMLPDDVDGTRKRLGLLSKGESTIASINRYRCKDGTVKWFSWNSIPKEGLIYTVGRDITEQVDAEERIQKLNAELEEQNDLLEVRIEERMTELRKTEAQVLQLQKMDAVGRLAGGIAHDFNNMLNVITLQCESLIDDPSVGDAVHAQIRGILDVTQRAAQLTKQLLVFSRKQLTQSQPVNLNTVIQDMEKMLTRLIPENVKIVTRLDHALHDVLVDPSQMEQVLMNLVVNARDALPDGGTIAVETSNVYLDDEFTSKHLSVLPGHYALLTVSDDGVGMDAATLDRIFEPFFTTKPVGQGTGLGLTTTYGIVKQARGTIWPYSEPGKGTVFKIYLPVTDKAAAVATEKPVAPVAPVLGENQTVLLVEDDELLRAGFSAMLRRKGYKVLAAANAEKALNLCQEHKGQVDLLLTDVVMPGESGFALGKRVSGLCPRVKILYMSGYTNDSLENAGVEDVNALDFIQKPFGSTALVRKIQEILTRK